MGILKLNSDGEGPQMKEEIIRCITSEILKDAITVGQVSGGKTQIQINNAIDKITTKHAKMFEGMG